MRDGDLDPNQVATITIKARSLKRREKRARENLENKADRLAMRPRPRWI